jgi:aryl-alcohol dehydrogenase-like predicted oxidoreductase
MMLEQRRFGNSGVRVSEIGIALRGPDDESAEIAREARKFGVDLFALGDSDDLPWLADALGPAAVTVLVATQAPPIGGAFRPDAHDGHLAFVSYSSLTELPGAMGPYRIFGGWEIGAAGAGGAPSRADVARRVIDDRRTQILGVPYTPAEQSAGLEILRHAHRSGLGIVATGLPGPAGEAYRFLTRPGRTHAQAAIQFVLANEYVSSALVSIHTADQLREAVAAPAADPLTLGELERLIELFAHRADGCM